MLLALVHTHHLAGQGLAVSAGLGVPEITNVGIHYYDSGFTMGMAYGLVNSVNIRTINLDGGFFYGKKADNAPARAIPSPI